MNLCAWKVINTSSYLICDVEDETVYHILWQCPSARDVWRAGCAKFQKSNFEGPSFLHVAEEMLGKCDMAKFAQFVSVARRIWLRRNEVVHGGSFMHLKKIMQQAIQAVTNFRTLRDEALLRSVPSEPEAPCPWKAPSMGWYKVNWDAGIDQRRGRVGLGAVVRDHQGVMRATKSQTIDVLANLAVHENMTTVCTIEPTDCTSEMLKAEVLALPRMI